MSRTHSFVFFAVHETRRILLSPFISKASRRVSSFFLRVHQLSRRYVATGGASYEEGRSAPLPTLLLGYGTPYQVTSPSMTVRAETLGNRLPASVRRRLKSSTAPDRFAATTILLNRTLTFHPTRWRVISQYLRSCAVFDEFVATCRRRRCSFVH